MSKQNQNSTKLNIHEKISCESLKRDADSEAQALVNDIASAYQSGNQSLRGISEQFGISMLKARKLLITAGVYQSELADQIAEYYRLGMSVEEIEDILSLSRASVHSYLPYSKVVYNSQQISADAERMKVYRTRQRTLKKLKASMENRTGSVEESLWNALKVFQDYPFKTAKNLSFSYEIRGNEMFISRKEKSVTRATIMLAFQKALELEGHVSGPKKLGCFGASYLYPVFIRIGVITKVEPLGPDGLSAEGVQLCLKL